jgi:hypothetical protein
MLTKFYENDLKTSYIMHLLNNTPIPNLAFIAEGDYMIADQVYVTSNYILKCKTSGIYTEKNYQNPVTRFNASKYLKVGSYQNREIEVDNKLIPFIPTNLSSNEPNEYGQYKIRVTSDYIENNNIFANYEVLDNFYDENMPESIKDIFIANNNYYDNALHERLGLYLRFIRATRDIDLMPFYNCFDNKYYNNFYIDSSNKIVEENTLKYKLALIPIKFNRKYTIAIQDISSAKIKPVYYKDGKLIKYNKNTYCHDFISNPTYDDLCKHSFSKPLIYEVKNQSQEKFSEFSNLTNEQFNFNYEKYLRLAIQIPVTNNSSIAVIEGDFSNKKYKYTSNDFIGFVPSYENIENIPVWELNNALISHPQLLLVNDSNQYAFSDTLLEYLLNNVVTQEDLYLEDVMEIETMINYSQKYPGHWNNKIRTVLFSKYNNLNRDIYDKNDVTGYGDRRIYNALRRNQISIHSSRKENINA